MGGLGVASAKLILFGEHAAVYGHPALGVSLPEATRVRVSGGALDEWDLSNIAPADRPTVQRILVRLEELMPGRPARGVVRIASNVPRGVGFGSSAALCGALARALLSRSADRGGPDQAWRLAHGAEGLFHGTPSGIDTGLALARGMHLMEPRPPGLPARQRVFPARIWLVVGAVSRDAACGALIAGLASRMKAGDVETARCLDELGGLSTAACDALQGPAEQAMRRLRALGLCVPAQDGLLDAGRAAGALGGKLSGAGGGGAFFMVAPDRRAAVRIARSIEAEAGKRGTALAGALRAIGT